MKLGEIKRGHTYYHRTIPHPICIVGPHPQDGAAVVGCYWDTVEDDERFLLCIPEDFTGEDLAATSAVDDQVLRVMKSDAAFLKTIVAAYCKKFSPPQTMGVDAIVAEIIIMIHNQPTKKD